MSGEGRAGARRPVVSGVRHGQASCADYGCRFQQCRTAARRARRERDRDRAAGLPARVDSLSTARYALTLRERGMSAQDIAQAAGVAVTLVRRLLQPDDRRPARVSRTTHEAVLGVPRPRAAAGRRPPAGLGLTDAAPVAARLADLAARGWPASHLAARLGVNARTVAAVRDGRHTRTTIALAQRVGRLHRTLDDIDPVSAGVRPVDASRARAWAARRKADGKSAGLPGPARHAARRGPSVPLDSMST